MALRRPETITLDTVVHGWAWWQQQGHPCCATARNAAFLYRCSPAVSKYRLVTQNAKYSPYLRSAENPFSVFIFENQDRTIYSLFSFRGCFCSFPETKITELHLSNKSHFHFQEAPTFCTQRWLLQNSFHKAFCVLFWSVWHMNGLLLLLLWNTFSMKAKW